MGTALRRTRKPNRLIYPDLSRGALRGNWCGISLAFSLPRLCFLYGFCGAEPGRLNHRLLDDLAEAQTKQVYGYGPAEPSCRPMNTLGGNPPTWLRCSPGLTQSDAQRCVPFDANCVEFGAGVADGKMPADVVAQNYEFRFSQPLQVKVLPVPGGLAGRGCNKMHPPSLVVW
jgi:hypothetical protein